MELESSGWRRGGEQNWLTPGKWSFMAAMSQCGPFWALAAGISIGRSDDVSSLGSTRWSSRISCTSGLWYLAGMNKTKPLREDSTHSSGRWRRAAHPSDSCGTGLFEIAAEFESPAVVSAIPAESIGFSPDGRCHTLPH